MMKTTHIYQTKKVSSLIWCLEDQTSEVRWCVIQFLFNDFTCVEFAMVNQGVVLPGKPSKQAALLLAPITSNIKPDKCNCYKNL